jgi:guanylate kinase
VFVTRPEFEAHAAKGGFLEWADFLGHLYGTPVPEPVDGEDLLLEIDLQGAEQIKAIDPTSVLVLLVPPSPEVQAARLRSRGDDEQAVSRRVAKGLEEMDVGRQIADHEVVNDEIERAVAELASILDIHRNGAASDGRQKSKED